jgi:hypothetical protein
MEAFRVAMVANYFLGSSPWRKSDEFAGLVANHVSSRHGGARPVLRLLARVRKDLGGRYDLPDHDRNGAGIHLPADRDDPPRMVLILKPPFLRRA